MLLYSTTYILYSFHAQDVQSGALSPNDVRRSSGGNKTN